MEAFEPTAGLPAGMDLNSPALMRGVGVVSLEPEGEKA